VSLNDAKLCSPNFRIRSFVSKVCVLDKTSFVSGTCPIKILSRKQTSWASLLVASSGTKLE
jgi:hypothetical protein